MIRDTRQASATMAGRSTPHPPQAAHGERRETRRKEETIDTFASSSDVRSGVRVSQLDELVRERLHVAIGVGDGDRVLGEVLAEVGLSSLASPEDLHRIGVALAARGGTLESLGIALKIRATVLGAQPTSERARTRVRRPSPSGRFAIALPDRDDDPPKR